MIDRTKQHLIDKDKYMCSCNQFALNGDTRSICNESKYSVAFGQELP